MKYEEINTFITVSKYLNISQAARALGISSTSCKYNIRSLGKETVIDEVKGKDDAVKIIERCIDRYIDCFCKGKEHE